MKLIVKVQIPVESTEPNPPALVYDEQRRIEFLINHEELEQVMGTSLKKYFEAEIGTDGLLKLGREVAAQPW